MSKTRRNPPFSLAVRKTSPDKGSRFGSLPSPDFPQQTTPYHSGSLQHAEAAMTQLELPFGAERADNQQCGSEMAAKTAFAVSERPETEEAAPVVEDDPGAPGKHNDDDTTEPVQIAVALPTGVATKPAGATTIAGAAHLHHPVLHLADKPETLDEAITALQESGQFATTLLKRLASDVRMATKLVHRTMPTENARPPSLPCAPAKLRDCLAVLPARHRMTAKRWSAITSSVAMVLKLTGWHAPNTELRAPLTPEWRAAADMIATQPQRALIAALGRYCAQRGILPADVSEETLEEFKTWRSENTLDRNARHTVRYVRCVWNRAQRASAAWPGRRLAPAPDPREYVLPLDQFDPGFLADVEAYLTRLQNPNPFDPVFNRKKAPLTLIDIRGTLLRAASVLVRRRVAVTSIRDVVAPVPFKVVLLEAFERLSDGKKWPSRATSIATYLFAAARDWAKLSPEELTEVTRLRKMVKAPASEMTQKSRDRIAQFDDPRLLAAFFELPYEMFLAADRMFKDGKPKRAAHLHQVALALAILQVKPLRRRNLAALEHGRHFLSKGSRRFAELRIPASETKGGAHLQAVLSERLARRIEKHISTYRPLIETVPCPFLFPNPLGNHVTDWTLASNVTKLVQRHVGAQFNVHLTRHLAATLLLDDDEGNLPVAQALLGHADQKTTARFYAQQRTRGAQIKWMQSLEKRVESAKRGSGRRSRRPTNPDTDPAPRTGT